MSTFLATVTVSSLALVVFHYIVYPMAVHAFARLRPHRWRRDSVPLTASLVTAAYNEGHVIDRKIDNALAVARPSDDVVFVSDGSTDGTTEAIRNRSVQGVVALSQEPRQGKVVALNHAVDHARGDVLIFSDATAMLAPDAVEKIMRNFADPAVGCVNGALKLGPKTASGDLTAVGRSEGVYWRYEDFIKKNESLVNSTVAVNGCLLALRRNLWRDIPNGTLNDDAYIALSVLRQGYRVVYEPEAECWMLPSTTVGNEMIRRERMTAGRFQALLNRDSWPWNNPASVVMLFCHKLLRLLMPVFLCLALAANVVLVCLSSPPPVFVLSLAGQLGLYAVAGCGAYAARRGHRWRLPELAFFFVVGNIGTLAGLLRYLRGRQTVLWQKAARNGPTPSAS